MTSTIQDYAIIGDGRSCALVAKTGSIDFLCWPRFDSDACLAALLGDERHGHWRVSPAGYVSETTRSYRDDTAILETEHVTDTGRVRVTDLMPWHDGALVDHPHRGGAGGRGADGDVVEAALWLRSDCALEGTPRTRAHFRGRPGSRRPRLSRRTDDGGRRRQRPLHARQGREDRLRPRPFAIDGAAALAA